MSVNKLTWAQVGGVTEPGRYIFRFGWLTITAEDLAIWQQFPGAAFTLMKTAATEGGEEFRLGAFALREDAPEHSPQGHNPSPDAMIAKSVSPQGET